MAIFEVKVSAYFSAAHSLRGYKGKCEATHGHNWKVQVTLTSTRLDELGMVIDFSLVKKGLAVVLDQLDHTFLNKLAYFRKRNPTSENIACFIYARLSSRLSHAKIKLVEVSVWETRDSCATYRGQE
jgi:6-pyruvoyltetrahydropterin/6-carboxytetrahydropterin synthase